MKVAFAVNGLGLGNATRVHRLIEVLISKGVSPKSLSVVTHAQALKYFRTNLPDIRCDRSVWPSPTVNLAEPL